MMNIPSLQAISVFTLSAAILVLTTVCIAPQAEIKLPSTNKREAPYADARLAKYFLGQEFKPVIIINNQEHGWKRKAYQKFDLNGEVVEWFDDSSDTTSNIRLVINKQNISLKEGKTVNRPDNDKQFDLGMVDGWEQIRLFEIGDQRLIGLELAPKTCTGLSCSVGLQLWYELNTKRITLFGSFKTDSEPRLFQFDRDGAITVLSTKYDGDLHNSQGPITITYTPYFLLHDGFKIGKDRTNKEYFIRHTYYPDIEMVEGKWMPKKGLPIDTIEQLWFEDVLEF